MDQTQREFLAEIEELLEKVFADLDKLREIMPAERASRRGRELIDRIFRQVHSVKGLAASGALEVVRQIAHEFENLLDEVRAGRVLINDQLLDTSESAIEALAESLSLAASGIVEPSRRALFDRLQAAIQNGRAGESGELGNRQEAVLERIPSEIWQTLAANEKQRLITIVTQGSPLLVVTTSFAVANFDAEFFRLKEKLIEFGEVISTSPAVDHERPDRINFNILYTSDSNFRDLAAATVDFSEVVFKEIVTLGSGPRSSVAGDSRATVSLTRSLSSLSNFVRTDLNKLDRLISSTNELLRTTTTALDLALTEPQLSATARAKLQRLSDQVRSSFMSVEHELINLRLVSLGPTIQRAARAGRAAARLASKEIDFEVTGPDILLDKLLVETIADPLIQLVRNAVDHGIESCEARAQAGKQPRGTVRIEALAEGSQSRLRVVDDGRGVEPNLISAAAMRLGIFTNDSPLDVGRSMRLIFLPGFTTLTEVAANSGRGVGLDIVETAVEQVGGEIRVSSEPGVGTTFEIRLPVTFGMVATNVVVSAGVHYCIPSAQTLGIDAIDLVDGASGANQLRQVSLRDLLGQPEDADDSSSQLHLITCQFTDERAALGTREQKFLGIVVDRVEGPQEVLVRHLGRHAGRWPGIAGATELKDGTVALVLDLPRLLNNRQ